MIPKTIHAWAATAKGKVLEKIEKPVPELAPFDLLIEVSSCGVCHSDLHLVDDDWGMGAFPLVPGHEIIGRAVAWGSAVNWVKPGDIVGVGWQRSACLHCSDCLSMRENLCDKNLATCVGHWGGYADYHVTDARFAFALPNDNPAMAPLFCGGATVFGPLCEFLVSNRQRTPKVGIVGLGGLGHLGVKFAAAMGAEVTLFSSSPSKKAEAHSLGATHFVGSSKEEDISSIGRQLDLIIVTANVDLPWTAYLRTLRSDGTLCFVGIPPSPLTFPVMELLSKRLRVAANPIANRFHIQKMVELANERGLFAEIETFKMENVNEALIRVRKNSVRYRAVLTR